MRKLLYTICLMGLFNPLFCQDSPLFPNLEFSGGVNRLILDNGQEISGLEPGTGFGIAVRKYWFAEKSVNLISGLVVEKTRYKQDFLLCGHFCSYRDMTFDIYTISIPLLVRVTTIGNKIAFFLEAGPALELTPIKWGRGTEILQPPLSIQSKEEIRGAFDHERIGIGANTAVGVSVPVTNHKIIFAAGYHRNILPLLSEKYNWTAQYLYVKAGILFN